MTQVRERNLDATGASESRGGRVYLSIKNGAITRYIKDRDDETFDGITAFLDGIEVQWKEPNEEHKIPGRMVYNLLLEMKIEGEDAKVVFQLDGLFLSATSKILNALAYAGNNPDFKAYPMLRITAYKKQDTNYTTVLVKDENDDYITNKYAWDQELKGYAGVPQPIGTGTYDDNNNEIKDWWPVRKFWFKEVYSNIYPALNDGKVLDIASLNCPQIGNWISNMDALSAPSEAMQDPTNQPTATDQPVDASLSYFTANASKAGKEEHIVAFWKRALTHGNQLELDQIKKVLDARLQEIMSNKICHPDKPELVGKEDDIPF